MENLTAKQCAPVLSQQGFTLLELMIVGGVSSVLMLGFAMMMVNSQKELERGRQKSAMMEIIRATSSALSDSETCTKWINSASLPSFKPPQLNTKNAGPFNMGSIPLNSSGGSSYAVEISSTKPVSIYSNNVYVTGIRLVEFSCSSTPPTAPSYNSGCQMNSSTFKAMVQIDVDTSKLVGTFQTLKFPIVLNASDAASPPNEKVLTSCAGSQCPDSLIWGCKLLAQNKPGYQTGTCTAGGTGCGYTCTKGLWTQPSNNSCSPP